MRVFKFGGASVKDAESVKNVAHILDIFKEEQVLVVVSAMGKMTNLLESLVDSYFKRTENVQEIFKDVKDFHLNIINNLGGNEHDYYEVDNLIIELECLVEKPLDADLTYDQVYDQIVPFGELLSTKIITSYLNHVEQPSRWIDARNFVVTNDSHRRAKVLWDVSVPLIQTSLKPILSKQRVVTQGFIGRNQKRENTTLGREGSDYTAAIFAYALDAESVTIWKDVEGVMNGDPKRFNDAILIPKLSYNEAIELAYFGASVIHPKTIQPLKSKKIPLWVKSFTNLEAPGTEVIENERKMLYNLPCYIVKDNQQLIRIATKDFSFIVEDNLQYIFKAFNEVGLQINLMQNSAISFSACFNHDELKTEMLKEKLQDAYHIACENSLQLFTIFNYKDGDKEMKNRTIGKEIVLEQKSDKALQLLLK